MLVVSAHLEGLGKKTVLSLRLAQTTHWIPEHICPQSKTTKQNKKDLQSLVYRVSFSTAKAIHGNPVSRNKRNWYSSLTHLLIPAACFSLLGEVFNKP